MNAITRTLGISAALLAAAATMPLPAHAAATCDPPQVLIVLDKSSSMTDLVPGTSDTKWDTAVTAIMDVLTNFGADVDFGLMIFPDPNECSPGSVFVDVGPGSASSILAELSTAPPTGGNWTPMAESLDAAASYTPMLDATRRNYVLLITDGWQWCSPYDPATRSAPVASAMNLLGLGVETYAVGFGGGVDVLTLNQVAWEGGTSVSGCDPNGEDPTASDLCYYQADNLTVLSAALNTIVAQITTDVCDGVDNDCDGVVDNGAIACTGACGSGTEICSGGVVMGCSTDTGVAEMCDGIDNNCDGTADEGCDCVDGATMPCGISIGACAAGTQTCVGGTWSACVGATAPAAFDACNGIDDNCDGSVDEGFPCAGGQACVGGVCTDVVPPPPTVPPGDDMKGGCHCRLASPSASDSMDFPAPALGLLLLGLVGLAARRRRQR